MALLLALPILASAQDEVPRIEIFGGYSYLRLDDAVSPRDRDLNGFNTSFTANLTSFLGITAEFSGHFSDINIAGTQVDHDAYFVAVGPRVALRKFERFTPYLHILVGMARRDVDFNGALPIGLNSVSSSGIALIVGGGVDLNVNPRLAVRLFQTDYILTRFNNQSVATELNQANFRASTGFVLRIGEQ
jgi:opacity protein-like surface antigen